MDPALWPALKARLAGLFSQQPRDHWAALFDGSDACVAPVLDPAEAAADPHMVFRASWTQRRRGAAGGAGAALRAGRTEASGRSRGATSTGRKSSPRSDGGRDEARPGARACVACGARRRALWGMRSRQGAAFGAYGRAKARPVGRADPAGRPGRTGEGVARKIAAAAGGATQAPASGRVGRRPAAAGGREPEDEDQREGFAKKQRQERRKARRAAGLFAGQSRRRHRPAGRPARRARRPACAGAAPAARHRPGRNACRTVLRGRARPASPRRSRGRRRPARFSPPGRGRRAPGSERAGSGRRRARPAAPAPAASPPCPRTFPCPAPPSPGLLCPRRF
jgi:hypothetical protein